MSARVADLAGRLLAFPALLLAGPLTSAQGPSEGRAPAAVAVDDESPPGPLRVDRGEGELPVLVPRDEELTFGVNMDLGVLGSVDVGTVTLSVSVEPHRQSSLVLSEPGQALGERGRIVALAKGGYTVYHVEETITTLLLPQEWPSIVWRMEQTGSENRRRELQLGTREGKYVARYRSDRHCRGCDLREHFVEPTWVWQEAHHCPKCKRAEHRVWRDPALRELPAQSLDMVSAVYLARSMIQLGWNEASFPLIDQQDLWSLELRRGETRYVSVEAGRFEATQVLLSTRPAPGEKADPKDFKGLFGIHGKVSIWFEARQGVPVLITGNVPIGPLDLDLQIALRSYRGTPSGFGPLR